MNKYLWVHNPSIIVSEFMIMEKESREENSWGPNNFYNIFFFKKLRIKVEI